MKKTLLLIMAVLLAFPGMRATERTSRIGNYTLLDECPDFVKDMPARTAAAKAGVTDGTYNFSYLKGSSYNAMGLTGVQVGDVIYQAIKVDPLVLKALADTRITAISTLTGVNSSTRKNPDVNVTVFLSHGLGQEPFYTQQATRTETYLATDVVTLATPQAFDPDQPLYVGYYFALNAQSQYTIPFDQVATTDPSGYLAVSTDGKFPDAWMWDNIAPGYGSLGISCTFTGTIPEIYAAPAEVSASPICKLSDAPLYSINVKNISSTDITSFTVRIEATGEAAYERSYSRTVSAGRDITFSLTGDKFTSTGSKDISVSVTTVNGKTNPAADAKATTSLTCAEKLLTRVPLYEIGTGTWCGWCPRSIVSLEYLHSDYEGKAIGIAYHYSDEMANTSSHQWLGYMQVSGYPSAYMNRTATGSTIDDSGSDQYLKRQLDETIAVGAVCEARINDFTLDPDGKNGTVKVDFRFSTEARNADFRVSMAVLEDKLGPYDQNNNYSGSTRIMGGWEKASNPRSYVFDDICRYLTSVAGEPILSDEGAVLSPDKDYPYDFRLKLENLTENDGDKPFRVVAIITDARTGEVLNAAQKSFVKAGVSDITGDSDKPVIETAGGTLTVSGARNVAVYNLSGVRVADGTTAALPAGLYIVRADGHTAKVFVK